MYVRATLLRRAGRREPAHADVRQVEGELEVSPRGSGLVAILRRPMSMSAPPVAELHDVRLVGAGLMGWLLRGYERYGDAAVLQEWRCEILHIRGFDGTGRPIKGA